MKCYEYGPRGPCAQTTQKMRRNFDAKFKILFDVVGDGGGPDRLDCLNGLLLPLFFCDGDGFVVVVPVALALVVGALRRVVVEAVAQAVDVRAFDAGEFADGPAADAGKRVSKCHPELA
jgi:hypothetical protein